MMLWRREGGRGGGGGGDGHLGNTSSLFIALSESKMLWVSMTVLLYSDLCDKSFLLTAHSVDMEHRSRPLESLCDYPD